MKPKNVPRRLRMLHNAAKEIGLLDSEAEIGISSVRHTRSALDGRSAALFLSEGEDLKTYKVVVSDAADDRKELEPLPQITMNLRCIVEEQRAIEIDDFTDVPAAVRDSYKDFFFAPLEIAGTVTGLLGVSRPASPMQEIDLELFCGIASVTAAAIEQAREKKRAIHEESKRLRLSRYFSPQVIDRLIGKSEEEANQALRCDATVLFSDIRGFTSLSEKRDPSEVLEILNSYFNQMSQLVFQHGGMVDKFLGDGLLAVFGAPTALPNHALAAATCAMNMTKTVACLEFSRFGFDRIRIGIGLHSGPVLVGDLGQGSFSDYTVLGATVNLAARVEDLTKEFHTEVVLTEATRSLLDKTVQTQVLDTVSVRGVSEPVKLHRLVDY